LANKELKRLKENLDSWVKSINNRIENLEDLPVIISENVGNIQHNYELIHELFEEMEEIKKEFNTIKIVQMVLLKGKKLDK
jgi:hypothetical protein